MSRNHSRDNSKKCSTCIEIESRQMSEVLFFCGGVYDSKKSVAERICETVFFLY